MTDLFLVEYGGAVYWASHPLVKKGKTTKGATYEIKTDVVQLQKTPILDVMMTNIPLKCIKRCPPDVKYSTFELEPVPRYLYNDLLERIDALERDIGSVERDLLERVGELRRDDSRSDSLW